MSNLRLGIPSKGRLSELIGDLLKQAGLRYRRQNRSLFARVSDMDVDIVFLRTDDIPVLCAEGAIDLGITGSDLVEEVSLDLTTCLKLGLGLEILGCWPGRTVGPPAPGRFSMR